MSEEHVTAVCRGPRLVRVEVHSLAQPGVILHAYMRSVDFPEGRQDVSQVGEPLQLSTIHAEKDKVWSAHAHLERTVTTFAPAQETWIVVAGEVEVTYYDLDDSEIGRVILGPGDCTITWRGGHGYRALKEGTCVYEIKSGPYFGRSRDKRLLGQP